MIELRTLGALELTSAAGTPLAAVLAQPKRTALLCYLALGSPPGFRSRDALYAVFWPEHDAEQARHALRQSLYFLRRALGTTAIVSRGDGAVALSPEHVRCDAVAFEERLEAGEPEAALALYRGDLLVGFHLAGTAEFERWLDDERARLRRRAAEAAWSIADAREREGDRSAAAEWGRRAAAFWPTDETVLCRLVLLLDRVGDRAAAVRAYEAFAWNLEREYDLEPSRATRELVAMVRAGHGASVRTAPGTRRAPEPVAAEVTRTAGPADGPRADAPDGGARSGTVSASAVALPAPVTGDVHGAGRSESRPGRARGARGGRRPRRLVAAGIVTASLVLLAGAEGWRLVARPRPALAPGAPQRVLVADFASRTSDTSFGGLVTNVLRTELARSPRLTVVGRAAVAGTLERMRAAPRTRLTGDIAREVAVREMVRVVVDGEVRAVGSGLIVSATVVDAASGDVIHGASETASDSTEVLTAVARLSHNIRQGIGESLASFRATDRTWRFTTASLAALRKHMAGLDARARGDFLRAVELLEQAIALDSGFTHAYISLAGQLESAGLPHGRLVGPILRAYEGRGELTERERLAVEGHYHRNVTGDLPKTVSAFREHLETPQCRSGESCWVSIYGATLELSGEHGAAERFFREASYVHSPPGQVVRVRVLYALRKDVEARRVLDEILRRAPEYPDALRLQANLLADSGRYDEAHALAGRIRRGVGLRNDLYARAAVDAMRGRVAEAVEHLRALRDQALALGEPAPALEIAAAAGRLRLRAGDPAGVSEVDPGLARRGLDSVAVLDRPYLALALLYAEAGRPRQAREWLDAYEREVPPQFRGPDRRLRHRARAAVHLAEGRPAESLAELQRAVRIPATKAGLFDDPATGAGDPPELARAYEAVGATDSAVAVYERYLAARSLSRSAPEALELGSALERLAVLYARRGDPARAAAQSRRLAALWHGGDAALRARAAAAGRHAARAAPRPRATG